MTPLVSILIPAFNGERWISDTIQSALDQTWKHKEIIIVDDGSKDNTLMIAQRFASKDVLVAHQVNQGASAARNKAFSLCQGDFVQWLDADDLLSPDKIEKQVVLSERLANRRLLISSPWGYFFYRPHKATFLKTPLWDDLSPVEWLIRKMGQNLHMQTATWLVSRELTEAAGPWDTRLTLDDDGEYFCRVLLASEGVRFVPGSRVYYRVSGTTSLSTLDRSRKKFESQWLVIQMHIQYLLSLEDSKRVRAACVRYLQTWFPHFYPEHKDLVFQFEALARELGGALQPPLLSWKYAWIQKAFGWTLAKRVKMALPQWKASLVRSYDKYMSQWESWSNIETSHSVWPRRSRR
jgi:glycosyltransferase involved in cell wall biosynthesis